MKTVNHIELKSLINHYYDTESDAGKLALFIWGKFGVGKSTSIKQVAQEKALEKDKIFKEWNRTTPEEKKEIFDNPEKYFVLIDIRLSEYDSSDIKGLPIFMDDKKAIEFKIPYWSLFLEQEKSDGILFFDEINLSTPLVMSSCYKIIYDRIVNDGKINNNWLILSAGNTAEDRAYTQEVSPPLRDRGGEVLLIGSSGEDWIKNFAIPNNIISQVIGYINYKESSLYNVDFDDEQKFTTYRGWERLSTLLKNVDKKDYEKISLIATSAIGEGIAHEFMAFWKIENEINIEEIIKNPKLIKDIKEVSIKYFLTSVLAEYYGSDKIKFNTILEVTKVLDEMNSPEFVALLWKMSYTYNKKFATDFVSITDEKLIAKYGGLIL